MGDLTPARDALRSAQERLEAKRAALGIGTRGDHARAAIRRGGIRVRCSGEKDDGRGCGYAGRARTSRLRRLRHQSCPKCGARMRPARWPGFDAVDVELEARLDDAVSEYVARGLVAHEAR